MSGAVRIDEALNLVLPVDRADGSTVWVHAAPISRETFQQHWLVLSKTFASIFGQGLHHIAGPQIAALALRDRAQEIGQWDGPGGVETTLLGEIRRLANVVIPGQPGGQSFMPLDVAMTRGVIDAEDADQIIGVLVFFSLVWRIMPRRDRRPFMTGAAAMWDASITSQTLTAFAASLPTLNGTGSTGATAPTASSPLSSIGQPAPVLASASSSGSTIAPGNQQSSSASVT